MRKINTENLPEFIDLKTALSILKISRQSMWNLIKKDAIKHTSKGIQFRTTDVQKLAEERNKPRNGRAK